MSRQQRLILLPFIGTILLCLFIGVYLGVWKRKRAAKSNPAAKVVKHSVETSAEEVRKYWTVEKMRQAKPVPLPNVDALKRKE